MRPALAGVIASKYLYGITILALAGWQTPTLTKVLSFLLFAYINALAFISTKKQK